MFQEFILPMFFMYIAILLFGYGLYKLEKYFNEKLPKQD
jgi:hypothetical protein